MEKYLSLSLDNLSALFAGTSVMHPTDQSWGTCPHSIWVNLTGYPPQPPETTDANGLPIQLEPQKLFQNLGSIPRFSRELGNGWADDSRITTSCHRQTGFGYLSKRYGLPGMIVRHLHLQR